MQANAEIFDDDYNDDDDYENFASLKQADQKKARFRRQIEKRLEQKALRGKLRDIFDD